MDTVKALRQISATAVVIGAMIDARTDFSSFGIPSARVVKGVVD